MGAVIATAAAAAPGAGLSPDLRPSLLIEPPRGALQLVHHAERLSDKQAESLAIRLGYWRAAPRIRRARQERRGTLPAAWLTSEPDRGFSQALLMQLSRSSANRPWRTLIVGSSTSEVDGQLQELKGQDAVVATVHDELVERTGTVELHVTMQLITVRMVGEVGETRTRTQVEYFASPLTADSAVPHRSQARFVMDGPLDAQISTAATDLSQFLATIVARVSVPDRLRPQNPTLGERGVHPACSACRASDPVVYEQPGRVWVMVSRPSGTILALPLSTAHAPTGTGP